MFPPCAFLALCHFAAHLNASTSNPQGNSGRNVRNTTKKIKQKNIWEHTRADLAGAIGSPPASSGSGEMKGTQQEHNKTRVTVI